MGLLGFRGVCSSSGIVEEKVQGRNRVPWLVAFEEGDHVLGPECRLSSWTRVSGSGLTAALPEDCWASVDDMRRRLSGPNGEIAGSIGDSALILVGLRSAGL